MASLGSETIPLSLLNAANGGTLRVPEPILYMIVDIEVLTIRGLYILSCKAW